MDRLQSFVDFLWDPLHPGGILCGILCGICTTCDGPHVTRVTRVGLVAGGCPRGWLGSWILSLACPSTERAWSSPTLQQR